MNFPTNAAHPIRFSKISLNSLGRILGGLQPIDIIRLASLSDETRSKISAARPKLSTLTVSTEADAYTVECSGSDSAFVNFHVVPSHKHHEELDANQILAKHEHINYNVLGFACSNKEIAGFLLVNRLLDFFNCRHIVLNLDKSIADSILEYTSWDKLKRVDTLDVCINGTVTQQEVTNILKSVRPSSRLHIELNGSDDDEFVVDRDFRTKALSLVGNTRWFGRDLLMRSDFADFHADSSVLSQSDLNQFMKAWLSGEFKNLTRFQISTHLISADCTQLIAGLPIIDYSVVQTLKNLQNKNAKFHAADCRFSFLVSSGYTLKRNDGKWATIYRKDNADMGQSCVAIRIWDEQEPTSSAF